MKWLSAITHLQDYDWRPVLPLGVFQAVYLYFMPWQLGYEYSALEPHQQVLAGLVFPVVVGTLFGFIWMNDIPANPSVEERILDDTE